MIDDTPDVIDRVCAAPRCENRIPRGRAEAIGIDKARTCSAHCSKQYHYWLQNQSSKRRRARERAQKGN